MNFNVDYYDFARKLIPYFLRKTKVLGLLRAILKPLQDLNGDFLVFRDAISFKLAFNAQIIYLEHYLNHVYPNPYSYPNNIHIEDGANVVYDYVWNHVENQDPFYLHNYGEQFDPVYFDQYSEQSGDVFSYIIHVPTFVQGGQDYIGQNFNETVLRKRVNFYNLAGKTYDIQYF